MKFDKSRVYTALNADELPIGSKCYFSNSLGYLKRTVEEEKESYFGKIVLIQEEAWTNRFVNEACEYYALAYLVEPPREVKYKPFETIAETLQAIQKHGGRVKDILSGELKLINGINDTSVLYSIGTGRSYFTPQGFLECFVFATDESPCGKLVEE